MSSSSTRRKRTLFKEYSLEVARGWVEWKGDSECIVAERLAVRLRAQRTWAHGNRNHLAYKTAPIRPACELERLLGSGLSPGDLVRVLLVQVEDEGDVLHSHKKAVCLISCIKVKENNVVARSISATVGDPVKPVVME